MGMVSCLVTEALEWTIYRDPQVGRRAKVRPEMMRSSLSEKNGRSHFFFCRHPISHSPRPLSRLSPLDCHTRAVQGYKAPPPTRTPNRAQLFTPRSERGQKRFTFNFPIARSLPLLRLSTLPFPLFKDWTQSVNSVYQLLSFVLRSFSVLERASRVQFDA